MTRQSKSRKKIVVERFASLGFELPPKENHGWQNKLLIRYYNYLMEQLVLGEKMARPQFVSGARHNRQKQLSQKLIPDLEKLIVARKDGEGFPN